MTSVRPQIEFRVLGPLEVRIGGRMLPVSGVRQRALLAALLLRRRSVVALPQLVDDVFGDAAPDDARNALQTYVVRLRRALRPAAGLIVTRDAGYLLDAADDDVDAGQFVRLLTAARGAPSTPAALALLDQALKLWHGRAFGEFADTFASGEAARLQELRLAGQEERADLLLAAGRVVEAVAALEALVADEPWRERAIGLLITALGRCGRTADALAAYARFRDRLRDDLGLDPSPQLQQLERQLLRGELGMPRQRSRPGLPVRATTFIGRESELVQLRDCVGARRLITLVGPGGVGKSRLAIEVAAHHADPSWVDLAALRDGDAVLPALADALGLDLHPGVALLEVVTGWARTTQGIVVLDNCEHLLGPVAALAGQLLAVSSELRLLATSRERVGIAGEQVFVVAPLAVPEPHDPDPENPAIVLFLDRARSAEPSLAADASVLAAVGQICRSLDGLPLAIELAAARVGTVTVDDLAARLDARFDLLRQVREHGDVRHQTLRSVVDWSFDLLTEQEQHLFVRLFVFAAGFDIDAVEAIAADEVVPAHRVADLLAGLAERSMLTRPGAMGTGRYRLFETLRSYAASHVPPEDAERLRRRHAEYFAACAERAEPELYGPDEPIWVQRVEAWLDDLRAAWGWARQRGEADIAVRLAAGLNRFAYWRLRGDVLGWGSWVAAHVPSRHRLPDALAAAAHAAWMEGRLPDARRLAERGIAVAGGPTSASAAAALDALGDVALLDGDLDTAEQAYRHVATHSAESGERTAHALAQANLLLTRHYAGAERLDCTRALAAAHATGNPTAIAYALFVEGEVLADDDPRQAFAALAEARRRAELAGNRFVSGVALSAEVALRGRHGSPAQAMPLFRDAIEHWRTTGNRMLMITTLRNLVMLLARTGRDEAAASLAATLDREAPAPTYGTEAARIQSALAAVQQRLGGDAYARARAAPRTLDTRDHRSA